MKIFVEFDGATYDLMVHGPGMGPMPAGCRLYRGGAWPADIVFSHPTLEAAEHDARLLRTYLASLPERRQSKKELRGVEA